MREAAANDKKARRFKEKYGSIDFKED